MGKLFTYLIVLILIILSAEGGYYWGLKRSTSLQVPRNNGTSAPNLSASPTPYPASVIPTLLSYKAAVTLSQNIPPSHVWQSQWNIGIYGLLNTLTDKFIQILYDGEIKRFEFPPDTKVVYSQWSESQQTSSLIDRNQLRIGDGVSLMFNIDTTSGNISYVEISKAVD